MVENKFDKTTKLIVKTLDNTTKSEAHLRGERGEPSVPGGREFFYTVQLENFNYT